MSRTITRRSEKGHFAEYCTKYETIIQAGLYVILTILVRMTK